MVAGPSHAAGGTGGDVEGGVVMLNRIIEARALPDYRLFVRFDDGAAGEVDLAHLVGASHRTR